MKWDDGERTMNKYIRRAIGHQDRSAIAALQSELCVLPLKARRQIQPLKLWGEIMNTPKNNYLRVLYEGERENLMTAKCADKVKNIMK